MTSPASAGPSHATVEVDRRAAPRITLPHVQAEILSLGLPVTVLEIGFGGLSIASEGEFEVGEQHELRCSVAGQPAVTLRVAVRHTRRQAARHAPRYVTGFQFIDVSAPGDHSALDDLIEYITLALSGV